MMANKLLLIAVQGALYRAKFLRYYTYRRFVSIDRYSLSIKSIPSFQSSFSSNALIKVKTKRNTSLFCFNHDKDEIVRGEVACALENNLPAIPALRRKAMLPQPILFHPLKHHLGYIREFIQAHKDADDSFLQAQLKTLGSSQPDLYLGPLSPQQITHETIAYLQAHHALEPGAYRLYLSVGEAEYQMISLSDESEWVLRWGVVEGRYVHLHPARYSRHTLRVKANALKSAIAVSVAALRYKQPLSLALVNQVRTQWLGLVPIPELLPGGTLSRLVYLLKGKETS